jgi:peptidoglycan-associated lipoprotein
MWNLKLAPLFLITSLLFIAGCSSTGKGAKQPGDEGYTELSESDLDAQREARYGLGSVPAAEGEGIFRDVRFGYDSAEVTEASRMDADYNAQVLKANPDVKIQLEGHCDERGTVEYNLALGQRRAEAVKNLLLSYGIDASRITTISYGEEVPLDPNHDEASYAKNRRVHFSPYRENTLTQQAPPQAEPMPIEGSESY